MRGAVLLTLSLFLALCSVGQPTADFSASALSGCAPLPVYFTDGSTGTISGYYWNLGNGVTTASQNASTTYSTPGTYTASLTVSGPGGTHTKAVTITVYDKPVATLSATTPLAGCPPFNVQFSSSVVANGPAPISYSWDFGDGTSGTGTSPGHTYYSPSSLGPYSVTLIATNAAGCSSIPATMSNYITVYTPPMANFSSSQTTFCSVPANASFSNASSGFGTISASWTFGNGFTGSGNYPSTTYANGGSFPVVLNVTDGHGCSASTTGSIIVVATQAQFSKPPAVCPGDTVTLLNTTAGNNGSAWDFGDGDTAVGNPVRHVFPPSGSFNVTLRTVVGTCNKTVTNTVAISPKPTATITMSPAIPCPLPTAVSFTANSPLATHYVWSWKSGGADTGQTVTKSYPKVGIERYFKDSVRLITTSAFGCRDTAYLDSVAIPDLMVLVNPGSLCSRDTPSGCLPFTVSFSTDLFSHLPPPAQPCAYYHYPAPASTWNWDFGDGTTSTSSHPTHTFTIAGTYVVRCVVGTQNGCTDTGYTRIHADTPVHPSFVAISPTTVCPGGRVAFSNTTDTPLANTIYTWYTTGDLVQKMDTDTASLRFKYPGSYAVRLITDHRGCIDTFQRDYYVSVNPPGSFFEDSIYCPPSTTVAFRNNSYQATSYYWDFGDGTTSTVLNPTHTYASATVYRAKLITYNSIYGCTDTTTHILNLNKPTLAMMVSDSTVCINESVHLMTRFYGDSSKMLTYSLYTDGYQTPFDTIIEFDHRYSTRAYCDVRFFTRYGNGCIDSLVKPGWIAVAKPAAAFSANAVLGCPNMNVTFTDASTDLTGVPITTRTWTYGDGDTTWNSKPVTATHVYAAKGRYDARLVVSDAFGCADTLFRPAYIEIRKPTAGFTTSDISVCAYQPITFNSTSTGTGTLQYNWNFGDGGTGAGKQTTHLYKVPGFYDVRLVVTDGTGCSDTLIQTNLIEIKAPHAGFMATDSVAVCPPLADSFTNTSTGAVAYAWNLGTGGTPATVTNASKTYVNPGVYYVSLIATDLYGCTDTARMTVRVLGYNGAFSYNKISGCVPLTVSFSTPLSNVPQTVWDFADGTIDTTAGSTAHMYTRPGTYLPKVIFFGGQGCYAQSLGLDSIHVDQFDAGFIWTTPCAGTAFILSDSSHGYKSQASSWLWYFGTSDSANGVPASYAAPAPGLLDVTLVAGNTIGCLDTISRQVLVHPLPAVTAWRDTTICPADTIQLAASGARSYQWRMPALGPQYLSCGNCDTVYFSPGGIAATTVYLSGKDSNGCIGYDSVEVSVRIKTNSTVLPGGEICEGESFRLHAEGAQSYVWLPAATIDSPFIASPLATPGFTTTYTVAAKQGSCLVDSQHVTVVVHPLPFFDAGQDEIINLGSAVMLQPTRRGIDHIIWRADTSLTCLNCFTPLAHPIYTRSYWATAYTEYGCAITDSVTVHVRCNGSLVFIPNSFTPNGDGLNDYFFPRGEGIERMTYFRVYDRWGELVFEKTNALVNDERSGWDGSYRGKALPPDTYVYTMQSRCVTGEPVMWKGDITLIR